MFIVTILLLKQNEMYGKLKMLKLTMSDNPVFTSTVSLLRTYKSHQNAHIKLKITRITIPK